jgi:hypothetical protein
MQIEFSPLTGVLVGVNYAYYDATDEYKGLNLVQLALGLFVLNITWLE